MIRKIWSDLQQPHIEKYNWSQPQVRTKRGNDTPNIESFLFLPDVSPRAGLVVFRHICHNILSKKRNIKLLERDIFQ